MRTWVFWVRGRFLMRWGGPCFQHSDAPLVAHHHRCHTIVVWPPLNGRGSTIGETRRAAMRPVPLPILLPCPLLLLFLLKKLCASIDLCFFLPFDRSVGYRQRSPQLLRPLSSIYMNPDSIV